MQPCCKDKFVYSINICLSLTSKLKQVNTITEQIKLMKQAIKITEDIETLERLIEPVDPITYKVMTAQLQNEYIDTCSKLLSNFLIISNVV